MPYEGCQSLAAHLPRPPEAEDPIGVQSPAAASRRRSASAKGRVSAADGLTVRRATLCSTAAGSSGSRTARRPKRAADGGDQTAHHRMQMKMLVRVAVIERQPAVAERPRTAR